MVGVKVKNVEFDKTKVTKAVAKGAPSVLGRAGGYVRLVVLTLLRRNRKSAVAGEPPSIHSTGRRALTNIQYAVESATQSVVIGPPLFSSVDGLSQAVGTVPGVSEFGGNVRVKEVEQSRGQWRRQGRSRKYAGKPTRTRSVKYQSHPFMAPALQKSLPKLSTFWANAVVA